MWVGQNLDCLWYEAWADDPGTIWMRRSDGGSSRRSLREKRPHKDCKVSQGYQALRENTYSACVFHLLFSSVNLTPPYIESAYRSANLIILEILGYEKGPSNRSHKAVSTARVWNTGTGQRKACRCFIAVTKACTLFCCFCCYCQVVCVTNWRGSDWIFDLLTT
jgi:hypothetical protein